MHVCIISIVFSTCAGPEGYKVQIRTREGKKERYPLIPEEASVVVFLVHKFEDIVKLLSFEICIFNLTLFSGRSGN